MKKFFQSKKSLTALILLVVIFGLFYFSSNVRKNRQTPLLIQTIGNDLTTTFSKVVNAPVSALSGGLNRVNDILDAVEENDHLKNQVENLSQTKATNATLKRENRQLKAALKLKNTLSTYNVITGSVISRTPDTWNDLLVIDKGLLSGVKKNQAVMSGGGIIGRIIEVSQTSSKVELITTTDKTANRFAVQATAKNGKVVHGIIQVTDNGELAFTQVVDAQKLAKGTKIYTSGLGGRSPKGLLIGTVKKTTRDSYGLSDVIKIKPAGELNDPSVVSVIERKVSE